MLYKKLIFTTLFLAFGYISVLSQNPYFIEKKPKKSEGSYAFLRRYKLDNNKCNMKKFLELNNLSKNSQLHIDKEYKLPILIYDYNGKSIRTTINNNDYQLALQIKAYNETLKKEKLRLTHYTKSKKLWVRYGDLYCNDVIAPIEKEEVISSNLGVTTIPIFGKQYQTVKIKDKVLKDRVFYIISGHGGPDPGARYVGKHTLCEDEYAYDVCLRLARNLIEHSATVHVIIRDPNDGIRDIKYLSCDKDERDINGKVLPLNQIQRLKQRANDVNTLYKNYKKRKVKSQIEIAIHVDARNYKKIQDVFFYHYKGSKRGKKAALSIQKVFEQKYKKVQKGREYHGTVTERDLYVLRETLPTSVYIELGNIKNSFNQRRLIIADNRQALANWIYLGLKKTYE